MVCVVSLQYSKHSEANSLFFSFFFLTGVELTIYGAILRRIFEKGNRSSSKSRRFCVIYSTVMIMLSTINIACNAVFGQEMWITHRSDAGGVPNFIATEVNVWYETLASTSVICCIFMGDALLVRQLGARYFTTP
jgi:hypothetical protein